MFLVKSIVLVADVFNAQENSFAIRIIERSYFDLFTSVDLPSRLLESDRHLHLQESQHRYVFSYASLTISTRNLDIDLLLASTLSLFRTEIQVQSPALSDPRIEGRSQLNLRSTVVIIRKSDCSFSYKKNLKENIVDPERSTVSDEISTFAPSMKIAILGEFIVESNND